MIKVALVDDHAIMRRGLLEIISKFEGISVIMDAANGKELLSQLIVAENLPDVCVLDVNMPEMNGYETALELKNRWPSIKVLALSMHDTEINIIKMLRSGACGYILKDSDPSLLSNAIKEVYHNGFYSSEVVSQRLWKSMSEDREMRRLVDVNEKEMQFLKLCASELTYKQIAEEMMTTPRSVDSMREMLFARLNVTTRTGLAIYAIKAGIAVIK